MKARKKDSLRKERDRLMEMNDILMDSILDIMDEYGIE